MNLLSAEQIRSWDQYTIRHEPVTSIQLMERAARACTKWLLQNTLSDTYYIFCGKGNNGGDGLAIARLLAAANKIVKVFVLESEAKGSEDYNTNFKQLHQQASIPITLIRSETEYPSLPPDAIIIDALFGTGLNRKLYGEAEKLVKFLNSCSNAIIAIDIPSGLFCDESSSGNAIIKASHTLSFQCLKMAFFLAENEPYFGQVHILDINLHPAFLDAIETKYQIINKSLCLSILKTRKNFSHKGNYGHALLIAGSYGKMGAAVLSAKACMKSGLGLLSCQVPDCGIDILQTTVPEAMIAIDGNHKYLSSSPADLSKYAAIGIGPAIGNEQSTQELLFHVLVNSAKPLVIDADALNIIAARKEWLNIIPEGSILTPHPKEFERLFGGGYNDYEKIDIAIKKSCESNIYIILKGHNSFIATPEGKGYFNITGNPGMATGGSGDVLTGLLTGLLAQGYTPEEAAISGTFLHGLAGDIAAGKRSMEAMIASDIIENIGDAFKTII